MRSRLWNIQRAWVCDVVMTCDIHGRMRRGWELAYAKNEFLHFGICGNLYDRSLCAVGVHRRQRQPSQHWKNQHFLISLHAENQIERTSKSTSNKLKRTFKSIFGTSFLLLFFLRVDEIKTSLNYRAIGVYKYSYIVWAPLIFRLLLFVFSCGQVIVNHTFKTWNNNLLISILPLLFLCASTENELAWKRKNENRKEHTYINMDVWWIDRFLVAYLLINPIKNNLIGSNRTVWYIISDSEGERETERLLRLRPLL